MFYFTIVTFHIISAGIWLIGIPVDYYLRKLINTEKGSVFEKRYIKLNFILNNIFGMAGALGIVITGLLLVHISPTYDLFFFKAHHWLLTKQFIMVAILIILFVFLIPTTKKIRISILEEKINSPEISEENYKLLKKYFNLTAVINLLVLLNLLLALSHRYIG